MEAQLRMKSYPKMASGFGVPYVTGGNKRATSRKQQQHKTQDTHQAYVSDLLSKQHVSFGGLVLLRYLATHSLTPRQEPMGSESDGNEYEGLATLLAAANAAIAIRKHTLLLLSSRTRTAVVCDMPLLMCEIDGSEGEDIPPRLKRTRRTFSGPTYKASSACAEMLWCGELVRTRVVESSDRRC